MRLPFVRLHLGRRVSVAKKARLLKDTVEDMVAKFPAPVFQLSAFFTSFSAALVLQAGEDYISVPVSAESWQ